jgi:hypothetical protein
MSRHLPTVANAFYIAAALLGLPALPGFLYFGFAALRLRLLTPASTAVSSSPDVMVNLIETGARIFGSVFKFIGDAGQWVITAFTAICFLILPFGRRPVPYRPGTSCACSMGESRGRPICVEYPAGLACGHAVVTAWRVGHFLLARGHKHLRDVGSVAPVRLRVFNWKLDGAPGVNPTGAIPVGIMALHLSGGACTFTPSMRTICGGWRAVTPS